MGTADGPSNYETVEMSKISPASVLLLTRFNCRFAASWTKAALDPKWLELRFSLFERYCLPSVLGQDCQNFTWILFFDQETPEPFRTRATALARENLRPIFVGTLSGELIRKTIREHIPEDASHVITSRLDNDDGLAKDYVRRLREAFRPVTNKEYLNVTEGFILNAARIYRHRDPHNAFVSLVEPVDGKIEGVWTYPHTEIRQHAPVRQIGGGPGWLQVVHGANVSNKVRGRRMPPSEVGENFILDHSELAPSGGAGYWWERNVMSRCWATRDVAAAAFRLGKRLVGKGWKPT
jgi:hypothetical protein